ncbi:MAG: hypothetical protein PUJ12_01420, partial [Oscillospiraceae bacterium]|nr:hypothetical protein [Oscillospiraceae bacterium]
RWGVVCTAPIEKSPFLPDLCLPAQAILCSPEEIWHNLSDERFSILKNVEHVIAQAAMMIRMHFIALFSLHGF